MVNTIKLIGNDAVGEGIEIPISTAVSLSGLVQALYDPDAEETQEIPLPLVAQKELLKIGEFMINFEKDESVKNIPKPIMSDKMSDVVSEECAKFLDDIETKDDLMKLLLAANYMNIPLLVNLLCATIASWAKMKTPEEIKQVFGITREFTQEEINQVKRENKQFEDHLKAIEKEEQQNYGHTSSAAAADEGTYSSSR